MLQNIKGSKIIVVDGKSWIVGERKISMWTESKCNDSKCNDSKCNEFKDDKVEDNKVDIIESLDKTEADKTVF